MVRRVEPDKVREILLPPICQPVIQDKLGKLRSLGTDRKGRVIERPRRTPGEGTYKSSVEILMTLDESF